MLKKLIFAAVFTLATTAAWAGEYVVEASNASGSDNIYYRVGLVREDGAIDWGIETKTGDAGKSLGMTTDAGNAIMIFRNDDSEIFYKVGSVDTATLTVAWGPKQQFAKGKSPVIDLAGTRVTVVYQGTKNNVLKVMTGWLEATRKQINWGGAFEYDEAGRSPTIAVGAN